MAAVLKERKEAQAGSTDPAPFTMDPAGAPVPLDGGVGLGSIPADWNTMWLVRDLFRHLTYHFAPNRL